jgi:CheY-like chemotaxis protein
MNLQVLLVEDEASDLKALLRDLPPVFQKAGITATLHPASTFEEASALIADPHRRYDLILSDTYRGEQKKGDAAVLDMVETYRAGRFCPLVVFSASARPDSLRIGAFVMWADKAEQQGIEKAVARMLATGIPQTARLLHDELDRLAGSYLWEFVEKHWDHLERGGHVEPDVLSRLIRRRAALQIAEITSTEAGHDQVLEVHGLEFYMYPPVTKKRYSLGQVIRRKDDPKDVRVILTPHCYLAIQQNQKIPRAEFVRVVKTRPVQEVLGAEKIKGAREGDANARSRKLRNWTTPPSGQDVGKPEGRYWYLPAFLEIPHLYCDFLQVDSLPYATIEADYESLAVLSPPYAESLQACWKAFDSSVGIPDLAPGSVNSILD